MPGEITRLVSSCQLHRMRSTRGMPSAAAAARRSSLSSQAQTSAPLFCRAWAAASPERPSPSTATGKPEK